MQTSLTGGPGVGGHQAGDQTRGRIYRIAPKNHPYKVAKLDLSTPELALSGLENPNLETRYLAYRKLQKLGAGATKVLENSFATNSNPRFRARAFWLLANGPQGFNYIQKAAEDANPESNYLYNLLRLRLKKMFELNAIDEVKKFYILKVDKTLPANKILGIEEIKKYLDKKISIEQAFEETFIRTRRYVKRQRTWFRGHMKDWISIFHPNFDILTKKIVKLVTSS